MIESTHRTSAASAISGQAGACLSLARRNEGPEKMTLKFHSRARAPSQRTQEVERLLVRYPKLDEQELARLICLIPSLPLIDRAVITADAQLSERLAAFYRDHGRELEAPIAALFLFFVLPVSVASAVLWWVLG